MKTRVQGLRYLFLPNLIITALVFIGCVLSVQVSDAATYYVAKNGSNSTSGTKASPFLTVNKGVSVLTPGDTVLIKGGTYLETLIDKIPSGTSWNSPVTVKAAPGHSPVIKAPVGTPDAMVIRMFSGVNTRGQSAQ